MIAAILLWLLIIPSPAQTDRLSPDQALARMVVADGLQVKTFAADPDIVSISNIDVDHRGRVWACEGVNYRGNRGKRPEGDRMPFEEGADREEVADEIRTRSDKEGVEAIIRDTLTVKIAADGRWAVEKKAGH